MRIDPAGMNRNDRRAEAGDAIETRRDAGAGASVRGGEDLGGTSIAN